MEFPKALAAAVALLSASCGNAAPAHEQRAVPEVVRLWPGQAPGTESWTGAEQTVDAELPNVGKVHIVTNVTVPTMTVFRPAKDKANGTAVVVVPGGAFRALPWDLDGTEPARWLTAHGITAFVLKYRVRPPSDAPASESFDDFARRTEPARKIAVADAEQAVRLIRSQAKQYAIAPDRVGMIGFSAGAMTTLDAAIAKDAAARPDFAIALYGALLSSGAPPPDAPPLFIAAAQDDPQVPPDKPLAIYKRWTDAKRPAELHLYQKGGHGFGFRAHGLPVDRWPDVLQAWLRSHHYLQR
ncbi:MAG: alpha/beta hydrolase [Bacillota bacterium]